VNNKGQSWVFRSAPDGNTWPWTSQVTMNGQTMQMRFTVKWTSKDSYDFKSEAGPTAASLAPVMDGKGTRAPAVKPPPK
jgi:hypothetical protein